VMQSFAKLPLVIWLQRYKRVVSAVIIAGSLAFLVSYTIAHPSVINSVIHTDPRVLLLLLVLYIGIVGTHFTIMYVTIRLCKKDLPIKNGIFLTIYSVVGNFFGPLQSGPGIRAVYLKRKIGLRVRDYTLATLFYYFAFASLNGSLLLINSWPLLTLLGFIVSVVLIVLGTKWLHFGSLSRFVFVIFMTTIIQIILMTTIYFIELHATSPSANYSYLQALVYSASANLSLFVSLTPGGIGIRESFIVFAQSLHHIPFSSVITAGILDRAFYILFLVLLFIFSSSMHLQNMFIRKKTT
jgi:uncharacterized membrane protein YbhN (UPF0104 family)